MTDRLGFFAWPAIIALAGCAITRPLDVALAGQPPERFTGDIATIVEWRTAEMVSARCTYLQAFNAQIPTGAHGCAYANEDGKVVLILPRDLHPLISHELGHAHQLAQGVPPDHKGFE